MFRVDEGRSRGYMLCRRIIRGSKDSEILRSIPGPVWDPDHCGWQVPEELLAYTEEFGLSETLRAQYQKHKANNGYARPVLNEKLKIHQCKDTHRAISLGAYFLQYDTGCGKTVVAIEVARLRSYRTLVVCPASVVDQWVEEFGKWAPELNVHVLLSKDDSIPKDDNRHVIVASYESVRKHYAKCLNRVLYFEAIIADESHKIKKSTVGCSRALLHLSQINPVAIKLCLSATPVTNRLEDFYGQLNFLTPGRFGSFKRFAMHYFRCEEEIHNDRRCLVVKEIKPEKVAELKLRIDFLSSYISKTSISHLFKGIESIKFSWMDPGKDLRGYAEDQKITREQVLSHYSTMSARKAKVVADLLLYDQKRALVFCYLRETANRIAEELQERGRTSVYLAHGGLTNKKRIKVFEKAAADPDAILITTLHAGGTGTNALVSFAPYTWFAELYWTNHIIEQALGRVNRINNEFAARVRFVAFRNTLDEKMALLITEKYDQLTQIKQASPDLSMFDAALNKIGKLDQSELEMNEDVDPFDFCVD